MLGKIRITKKRGKVKFDKLSYILILMYNIPARPQRYTLYLHLLQQFGEYSRDKPVNGKQYYYISNMMNKPNKLWCK